ncbi:hypothetical protein J2S68_002234 [Glycomyces algeriensis]|nr:hypothetical protein [Glycomyces algeriensis]
MTAPLATDSHGNALIDVTAQPARTDLDLF